jgi:hypothetical protein
MQKVKWIDPAKKHLKLHVRARIAENMVYSATRAPVLMGHFGINQYRSSLREEESDISLEIEIKCKE